jgi:hypothetical protein
MLGGRKSEGEERRGRKRGKGGEEAREHTCEAINSGSTCLP